MTDSTPHEDTREDTEAHALRDYKYDVNGGDGVNAPDAEGHALSREQKYDVNGADGVNAADVEGHAFLDKKRDINGAETVEPTDTGA